MSLLAFSIGGDSPGLESLAWGRGPLAMAGWAQDLYGHGEREMAWRALPAAFEWALAQAESAVFISAPYAESGLLAKARAWSEGPDAVLLGAKSWGDLGPSLDLLGLRRGGPALGQLKALLAQIQGSPRQRRLRQLSQGLLALESRQSLSLGPRLEARPRPHAYYADGLLIGGQHRELYLSHPHLRQAFGEDPFASADPLFQTQARPEDLNAGLPLVTLEMAKIWQERQDLQGAYPEPFGKDRVGFCRWSLAFAWPEYRFTEQQLGPIRRSLPPLARLKALASQLRQGRPKATATEAPQAQAAGLNLLGLNRSQIGIGESCRLAAASLQAAKIDFGILNLSLPGPQDLRWAHAEISQPRFRANLIHLNAPELRLALRQHGPALFKGRFSIGVWHWELPLLPQSWIPAFESLDEIWAPSRFVADAILEDSPVPVRLMPHGLAAPSAAAFSRAHFGLPEEDFLFLFSYDVNSFAERKNPEGVLSAFQSAFGPASQGVGLVLKLNHAAHAAAFRERFKGWKNIHILEQPYSRLEISSLQALCDSFVSLHRCEGFGLGPAECLALGKPVIATRYSSTADFMLEGASCPVDSRLIEIGRQVGPYDADQVWAEPDLGQAAAYMLKCFKDRDWAKQIGAAGAALMASDFSQAAAGQRMRARLQELGLLP